MRTLLASRWRIVLASAVAVGLVASVGVWAAVHVNSAPTSAVDCSSLEATTFGDASALAHACKADVEVLSERTPWQTSWATSENTARLEVTTLPSRVQVDGEWKALDATLVVDKSASSVNVVAPVFPMRLNAGGTAGRGMPLGSITRDGKQLNVWFPLDLPAPKLSGSQAVYELDKGIRLVVSVNVDATGFFPVVELDDAQAADRFAKLLDAARAKRGALPAGLNLEYATTVSEGLSLNVDEANSVHVVDATGETVFQATSPLMWDSSGKTIVTTSLETEVGSTDRTQAPAGDDHVSAMNVTVAGKTITVSPDLAMIKSRDTTWPVYIDPGFSGATPSNWVAVRTGGYTSTLVQWKDLSSSSLGQGTGDCTDSSCTTTFKQRLAWKFSGLTTLAALSGSDISAARFSVDGEHSYNCSAQTTTLWRTSDVGGYGTGANWNNLQLLASYGTRTEAQRSGCAYGGLGFRDFDATGAAKWAADNNSSTLNLALIAGETNMLGWKRFRSNATLAVDYDRPPDTPTSLRFTSPNIPTCTTGASRPIIATTTPTIAATSTDPDLGTVQTAFVVASQSNLADIKWSSGNQAAVASGTQRSVTVPSGLVDGGIYAWRAQAFDGTKYSLAWSPWCEFAVDITAPAQPTVAPVTSGVQAIYVENVQRGGVQQQGQFTLGRNGSTDVASFQYGFNSPTSLTSITPDANGNAVISFTPTTTGTVTLTVKSVDAAGNFSPTKTYTFGVATPTQDGIWIFDEGSGTTAADTAGSPARPLTLSGATWGQGPHSLFDSRPGDTSLALNGVNAAASTTAPVVDTTGSFVVSAHVLLDPTKVAQGQSFTALSQDGVTDSGFQLGYTATCAGMANGCWSFSMPDALSGSGVTAVQSSVPVTGGEWTYLVGEQDISDHTLQLWVCDIGTPTNPAPGDPVKSQVPRAATPWAASGAFIVGRGLSSGANSSWWPGAIDNVRVFSGAVVAESKIRRLCQGAEPTDFGGSMSALDPTTAVGQ